MFRDFRLEEWLVQPRLSQLEGPEGVERAEPRSIQVLALLAERAGEVVSREELLEAVWGETFVTEEVLTHAIWDLRRALRDDSKKPRFIQTVPRRGYRLTATISWLEPAVRAPSRYELLEQIGEGARGVVFKAKDNRLDRLVALKFLPAEWSRDADSKERFLREARMAAALDHPNICTLHEVDETADGRMFLVMAYYEGETLKARLVQTSLEVGEALQIALQVAKGLARSHQAGVIHRDVKPSNLMLTGRGDVKILDFGVAKYAGAPSRTRTGASVGTPAYMSPEQARGEGVDHRTDLWSLGVVLYEMLAGRRPFPGRDEQAVIHSILSETPTPLLALRPDLPAQLGEIVARALRKDAAERYPDAGALVEDLRAFVSQPGLGKPSRLDGKTPYPGLAPYTEAELFFGRDAEVEAVWARLRRRELLAIISPSGAGKTSFLRAGILPALPAGWRAVVCQPAGAPWRSLAQALVPELAGDHESLRQLLRFEEPEIALSVLATWRRRHTHVLLVVDQFEELFTQSSRDVQARFAELLGRAAGEVGVHVLLALRDDFLFSCHAHPALAPVFSELTPLGPLAGAGLRRALVEPARACGYGFEDEALVDEMLADVSQERGALPLLAFAAARLWEARDREACLLTRRAYQQIGGVAGALAQHAEATLAGIGDPRQPMVREIFRNLVTVQGTRAAIEVEELLSTFADRADREEAQQVLAALMDARLVTSFEVPGSGESPGGRWVEIIHESLLSAWPRLVRWQTQDADGAQLRDQLRQAARLWESRGRPADLLWTGASFLELQVWRQRYPVALTATEESFARAAAEQAGRRRRRRWLAVAAAFAILLAVLMAVGLLWWKAANEARRANASKLLALARLELDRNPSAVVAYVLASLELTDSPEARSLAVEALWQGPTAFVARRDSFNWNLDFSPDGRRLAVGGEHGNLAVWSQEGGAPRVFPAQPGIGVNQVQFGAEPDTLVTYITPGQILQVWSAAAAKTVRTRRLAEPFSVWTAADRRRMFTLRREGSRAALESWPFDGQPPRLFGHVGWKPVWGLDPGGNWLAYAEGRELRLLPMNDLGSAPARLVGRHESPISRILFAPGRIASLDTSGELRLWPLPAGSAAPGSHPIPEGTPLRLVRGLGRMRTLQFDSRASLLATADYDQALSLWDLEGPPEAEPTVLRQGEDVLTVMEVAFHPAGRWLAAAYSHSIALWPLSRPYARILREPGSKLMALTFAPDGSWIASASQSGVIRLWPLTGAAAGRVLFDDEEDRPRGLSSDPAGRYVAAGFNSGKVRLLPLGPGPVRELNGFGGWVWPVAVGPGGRLVAAGGSSPWESVIRIWDLETGKVRLLDAGDKRRLMSLQFLPGGRLASAGEAGLRLWRLADGSSRVLRKGFVWSIAASRDGRYLLSAGGEVGVRGEAVLFDLVSGGSRRLASHGSLVGSVALDPSGTMAVTGGFDGVVRAGPVTGEAPHLLLGHRGTLWALAVHPGGRWIASAGEDRTIRLWPMPKGPPFHTLPYREFLARLRALTNYRVLPDGNAPAGYRLETAPFPGWASLPTW